MALSLALHGLALAPLLFSGTAGSVAADEQALMLEMALAAPAPAPADPSPLEAETVVAPPEEPTPVDAAELKPVEPPKPPPPPPPQPKPPVQTAPRPPQRPAAVTQSVSPPDSGTAQTTQAAVDATKSLIVWENSPRFRVPPTPAPYPRRALELGQQGVTLVRVRLDLDGSAAEILLWRGSGFELLDRAALAAVRGWQFLPAVRDGHAVAAWVEIPVRFHLH